MLPKLFESANTLPLESYALTACRVGRHGLFQPKLALRENAALSRQRDAVQASQAIAAVVQYLDNLRFADKLPMSRPAILYMIMQSERLAREHFRPRLIAVF